LPIAGRGWLTGFERLLRTSGGGNDEQEDEEDLRGGTLPSLHRGPVYARAGFHSDDDS
jgi:hypothetical protein